MEAELYKAAAITGDISKFLQTREDLTDLLMQLTPNKNNILHIAALFNKLDFFKQVIVSMPPSNSFSLLKHPNSKGDTPLHVAARSGCTNITDFIVNIQPPHDIEKGEANRVEDEKELIRMVNHDGDNALHLAARYGYEEVAAALLDSDPELSTFVNNANESAFYIAIINVKPKVAKLIMEHSLVFSLHGAANGRTALHAALYNYDIDIDYKMEMEPVRYPESSSYLSPREEWHQIMEKITEVRPEMITEVDTTGRTPLHLAADLNASTAVIKLLVGQRQSAAYLSDNNGETALHIAAHRGHVSVMKEIINICPDCWDIVDNKGRTALHSAVLGGDVDAVRFILAGFNGIESFIVNEGDEDGNTALHLAAMHNNEEIMEMLKSDKRVQVFAVNKNHLTALDLLTKEQEKNHGTIKQKTETSADFLEITATLIATVTFSAAFTLPGGYIQSGSVGEGMAVLASKRAFQAFIIFDIIAFFAATNAFYQLQSLVKLVDVPRRYVKLFIGIAFLAMQLAFTCGIYVVLVENHDHLASAALTICLLFLGFECVRVSMSYYKNHYRTQLEVKRRNRKTENRSMSSRNRSEKSSF